MEKSPRDRIKKGKLIAVKKGLINVFRRPKTTTAITNVLRYDGKSTYLISMTSRK